MNNDLQEHLNEAANWIEELALNLRSGNRLTKQHSEELYDLTTALSELSTTEEPLGPLHKHKRKGRENKRDAPEGYKRVDAPKGFKRIGDL